MFELWCRLKNCQPVTQFDQFDIESVCHLGMGQLPLKDGGHYLQPRLALHLMGFGQPGLAAAPLEPSPPYLFELGLPGVQCCFDHVFSLHDWLMELGYLNSRLGGLGPGIDWQAQKSCQQRQTSVQQIQGVEVRALQSRMAQQCHC